MLSIPFRFEFQEGHQQIFFRAFALREELVTMHGAVSRTAFQRIYEIARFKQLAEKDRGAPLSNKMLADVYRARLSQFNGAEVLNPGFIDNAMTVYDRAARIPEVQAMIIELENHCGDVSPFNSVTKMHFMVKRQKLKPLDSMPEPQLVIWLFGYISDLVLSNACPPDNMSTRFLGGDATNRACIIGMGHMKLGLLRHLVDSVFPGTLCHEAVTTIGSKLATFSDYRANHTPYSAEKEAATAWLGALPESGRLAVALLDDLVFAHNNGATDAQLRQAMRLSKSAPEVWAEADTWRPRWEAIELAAKTEKIANGEAVPSAVVDDAAAAAARDAANAAHQVEETVRGGILHMLQEKSLPWYRACAYRAMRTYISLAPEPELASVLKTNIMNCPLKDIRCTTTASRKCVLFLFDATTIGEAPNHPMWRFPALQEGRVRKLVSSALAARNDGMDTCKPCDGDVFLLFDGGRQSETILLTPFRITMNEVDGMSGSRKRMALEGDVHRVTLAFTEASVRARRMRARGEFDLRQTATMYMVTAAGLKQTATSYPAYPGCTSKGDLIMPIQLTSHSDPTTFNVRPQDKAAIWGIHRPGTGGVASQQETTTAGEEKEPVCFHGMSSAFFNSVFDALRVTGVCDLSVGGGAAAEAALSRKIPYYGICPTEHHVRAAQDWLAERALAMMADPSSSFYDAEYAKARVQSAMLSTNAAPSTVASPTPGPTPIAVSPPKKPKKNKKADDKKKQDPSCLADVVVLVPPVSLATVDCASVCVVVFVLCLKDTSAKRKRESSSSSSSDSRSE